MRDKPIIEVAGNSEEIEKMFRVVKDTMEQAFGMLSPEDAKKARFEYSDRYGTRSFSVSVPREDEE